MHIRIFSPAGHCDSAVVDGGVKTLKSWGFDVSVSSHAKGKYGRFAGTVEDRAQDIIDALNDPEVDVLYASRGGYGCMQILDKIPLELIASAKKPVFGYSDITALHALWQKAGVVSVHAHMMKHLGEDSIHPTVLAVKDILVAFANKGVSASCSPILNNKALSEALNMTFSYPIIGGNLAVLSGLHGTPFDFDYKDKILFIEDIKESPYKVDRMMNQLRLGGVFSQIKALIIGQFTGCDEDPEMPKCLYDTMKDMVEPYGIPMIFNAPIGHVDNNVPVVEGMPMII